MMMPDEGSTEAVKPGATVQFADTTGIHRLNNSGRVVSPMC
jgi:hypothetical protein